jgi:Peptidase A4 family
VPRPASANRIFGMFIRIYTNLYEKSVGFESPGFRSVMLPVAVFLVSSLLLLSAVPHAAANSQSTGDGSPSSVNGISVRLHSIQSSFNITKAIDLATRSSEYAKYARTLSTTYFGMSFGWTFDEHEDVNLASATVLFIVLNGSSYMGILGIDENAVLTKITGSNFQSISSPSGGQTRSPTLSGILSGYEFYGAKNNGVPVYEANAQFTVPSVSKPSTGSCQSGYECGLSNWVGLEHGIGGPTGVVQAGVDSCYQYCSYTYEYWIELDVSPGGAYYDVTAVNGGDSVYIDVTSQGLYTPSNYYYYTFTMLDYTTGRGNSTSYLDAAGLKVPKVGAFLAERDAGTLPTFATFSDSAGIEYNSTLQSIYNPAGYGYDQKYRMENGCSSPNYYNINLGTVSSMGTFSQTFVTSCGT